MRENLSEQVKILELQSEKLEQAKIAVKRDEEDVHEQLQKVTSDIHLAKYTYKSDYLSSSRDKFNSLSRNARGEDSISSNGKKVVVRKLSEISNPIHHRTPSRSLADSAVSNNNPKLGGQTNLVKIKFDGSDPQQHQETKEEEDPKEVHVSKEQINNQIDNYEMNEESRKFLHDYLNEPS